MLLSALTQVRASSHFSVRPSAGGHQGIWLLHCVLKSSRAERCLMLVVRSFPACLPSRTRLHRSRASSALVVACAAGLAIAVALAGSAAAVPILPWTPNGMAVAPTNLFQRSPAIAPDADGGAYVVWEDDRNGAWTTTTFIQRLNAAGVAQGWSPLGYPLPNDGWPRGTPVALPDGQGGVYVVDDGSRVMFVNRVAPDGDLSPAWPTTGVPVTGYPSGPIGGGCCHDFSPRFTLADNGLLFLVWIYESRFSSNGRVIALTDSGPTPPGWSSIGEYTQCVFCDDEATTIVAPSDSGAVFVALHGYGFTVRKVDAAGGVNPVAYAFSGGRSPGLVPDGHGGVLGFWEDNSTGFIRVRAVHLLRDLSVAPGWDPTGNVLCDVPTAAGIDLHRVGWGTIPIRLSSVASDDAGGAFVVWTDYRDSTGTGAGDIYAQHVRGDGSLAQGWPVNGLRVCNAAGDQRGPRIAADHAGGVVMCWEDRRNGVDFDIYALRVDGDGVVAPGWPENGLAICTASGDQTDPVLTTDDRGNAIIAWEDARSHGQVYAARVSDDALVPALGAFVDSHLSETSARIRWWVGPTTAAAVRVERARDLGA